MAYRSPVLIIFHGSLGAGEAERMMAGARVAAARIAAFSALDAGFEAVIVATDDPATFDLGRPGILVDPDVAGEPYDFHSRLAGIVERYGLERPAVMGSGSVPLLGAGGFAFVAEQLEAHDRRFVTNNFYSADLTAWTPGEAVHGLSSVPRDNVLPRRLRDEAGLAVVTMPRTTETQFDLDTPADLAVLAVTDGLPAPLAEAASAVPEQLRSRLRRLMARLCDPAAEIVVAGRVGSQAWHYLERETACRVRMFSEERGLAAMGRARGGRSLLGFYAEEVGFERFFRTMAELGDALVLDTRVLESHLALAPTREDRFQSDLLEAAAVHEPVLRALTAAAADAPGLVLLGGHSLVSGGLMALNDQAWRENDRRSP